MAKDKNDKFKTNHKLPQISVPDETLRKLVSVSQEPVRREETNFGMGDLNAVGDRTLQLTKGNESILELFPNLELGMDTMVSSVLSPNDMMDPELIYELDNVTLPSDVKTQMIELAKNYLNEEYDLNSDLPKVLTEILYTKGAHIELIIPSTSIQTTIESTRDFTTGINKAGYVGFGTEEFRSDTGLLLYEDSEDKFIDIDIDVKSKKESISISKDFFNNIIPITDDPSVLTLNAETEDKYLSSMESFLGIESLDRRESLLLEQVFSVPKISTDARMLSIPEVDNVNNDKSKPMVLKVASRAVIPLYETGDETKHLAYFILIDHNGKPLSDNNIDEMQDYEFNRQELNSVKDIMITQANRNLGAMSASVPTVDNIESIFESIFLKRVQNKINNSKLNGLVDEADLQTINKIMFGRTLRKLQTTLLYVPSNFVAYSAINFRRNGTGESLLERVGTLVSIKAMVFFSSIMSKITNSIPIMNVKGQIDPKDPDSPKTLNMIYAEALKSKQALTPFGINSSRDLVNWLHRAGIIFNVKGPGIPDMDIEIDHDNRNIPIPDQDTSNELDDLILMGLLLNPEMVSQSTDADYAATVVAKNRLQAKRTGTIQKDFLLTQKDRIRKLLLNDYFFRDKYMDLINANYKEIFKNLEPAQKDFFNASRSSEQQIKEFMVTHYIKSLKPKLPSVIMYEENGSAKAFREYKDSLEEQIETLFDPEALPDFLMGQLGDNVDEIKYAMFNTLLRKWRSENNYMPELSDITTIDAEGNPKLNIFEDFTNYMENLAISLEPFFKKEKKIIKRLDKSVTKFEEEEEEIPEDPEETEDQNEEEPVIEGNEEEEPEEENVEDDEIKE